jgi:Predicted S-adenosylmethionine-dependent methyltransferase
VKTDAPADKSSLLYNLTTILDRIDLAALFAQSQVLEVELGSGDGSFLAEYARRHPERNFIGVERLLGRARKIDRKGRRFGLTNVRAIRIESSYFLDYLLPRHSAAALHIYFPDPWPKKKHRRHRLINECFPILAAKALTADGCVHLRTDDADYFNQMAQVFSASAAFHSVVTPPALAEVVTDFERAFQSEGISTLRASYQKR